MFPRGRLPVPLLLGVAAFAWAPLGAAPDLRAARDGGLSYRTPESPGTLNDEGCDDPPGGHAAAEVPAPDLHCFVLHPTRVAGDAGGRVLLLPPSTPFGVAVDREGHHRRRLVIEARGLPHPSELGDYDRYMAWVTPPTLAPMIPLGRVGDGRQEVGEAAFNVFLVLVSAEGPDVGDAPRGPLVLRGSSPAMVLRPDDLPLILSEMAGGGRAPAHGDPAHGGGDDRWTPPPMHPQVSMPPALMTLRPEAAPFHPIGADEELPEARPREEVWLADGDSLVLEAGPLLRRIGEVVLPGYGYNGQIPGPLIRAREGSTVHVRFRNRTSLPSTVHWHGIRLENAFDGVPGLTQAPVLPGEDFDYRIRLPDPGLFWYHPHLREDVAQDLGLAGNLQVIEAGAADPWAPVHGDEVLLLDDHLIGPGGPVPYGRAGAIHALMGRFGNELLVNNRTDWSTRVRPGAVVRFHLTNAANTRTFNLSFGELPVKVVAGDVGRMPREAWSPSVVIAPAERWVVDVRFPAQGRVPIVNRVQAIDHMGGRFFSQVDTVGIVEVAGDPVPSGDPAVEGFEVLRATPAVRAEVDAVVEEHRRRPPDHTLLLRLRTRDLPFPLDPLFSFEGVFRPPVEWAGTMPEMDWLVSTDQVEWILEDPATGAENMQIDWRFRVGDRIRIRLVNDRSVLHPMQHPIHVHGQRFLVLAVNGVDNAHPAWKDTALVPVGSVVDLVVEMSNPGDWMIHCHIAEHLETGMMAAFRVDP